MPRSTSSELPLEANLTVRTDSPLTELFLVDSSFALAGRAIGSLESHVPVGAYKIKARLGGRTVEKLIVLDRDRTVTLGGELKYKSPVPLLHTTRTHEFHMDAARQTSTSDHVRLGQGARLLLMARCWSDREERRLLVPSMRWPARSVSVETLDGHQIVNLERDGHPYTSDPELWDPCISCAVEIDPGAYVLRWRNERGIEVQQTLFAAPDWQTQVFLLRDLSRVRGELRSSNHTDERIYISILMSRNGFDPTSDILHVAEEARVALAEERQVGSEMVNKLLCEKVNNPTLGLLGAHLMLLARTSLELKRQRATKGRTKLAPVKFEQSLFDKVVRNLSELLGKSHPDIIALATQSKDLELADLDVLNSPPMLWRSWRFLVAASNSRPELVPKELWLRVADDIPVGPFFVWRHSSTAARHVELMKQLQTALGRPSPEAPNDVSFPIGSVLDTKASPPAPKEEDLARRSMSLQLLVPRGVIDQVRGPIRTKS